MQRALESALAELTLGPEIALNDSEAIAAWLERHRIDGADAAALTRDFSRLQVYRKLVRGNLRGALFATIPRTLLRLGTPFDAYFEEFLRVSPPVTRSLRDLTPKFLSFVEPRWKKDPRVAEYLLDLGRHEALQIELASLPSRPQDYVPAELSLDQGVEFIDAVRLVRYAWGVHRLPDDPHGTALPEASEISLLVYRSPEHEVRYLELGTFAEAVLSGLLVQRQSLRTALERAARQVRLALDDALLTRAARLLSDLAERGVLLGKSAVEPSHEPSPCPERAIPTPPQLVSKSPP